jgi:hypothetical protein
MTKPEAGDIWEDDTIGPFLVLEVLGYHSDHDEYDVTVMKLKNGKVMQDWYIGLYDKKLA